VLTTKLTHFVVYGKDEWETKEGRGKSLAMVELCESEGIRLAVSQSVENSIKYFFLNSVATL